MLFVNDSISIPISEFQFSFSRSPGPGGQNVNKVNTKATMTWMLAGNESLPADVMNRLRVQCKNRINRAGEMVITSHRFRDQSRNVADCLAKLRELIAAAAIVPKKRKPSKPSKGSIRRRLDTKKKASDKKNSRRPIRRDE